MGVSFLGEWHMVHTQKEARLLEEAGLLLVIRFLPLALLSLNDRREWLAFGDELH